MIVLDPDFAALLPTERRSLDALMALDGTVFRAVEGRRTLRFELGGRGFYAKLHGPAGWRPVLKSLAGLRWPAPGAGREWRVLRRLATLGIPAPQPVAFGQAGRNPAHRRSALVMTEVAPALSLEDFALGRHPFRGTAADRQALIREAATLTRRLHQARITHRDLYLCHYLLPVDAGGHAAGPLHLIDFHRAQIWGTIPDRWLVKDLSGLVFSAGPLALSRTDRLRFVEVYEGWRWRHLPRARRRLWAAVAAKAERLARRLGDPATADTARAKNRRSRGDGG